jgi:urease accessory protein
MDRDAKRMRGDGPTVFAQVKNDVGVDEIVAQVVGTWERAVGRGRS